MTPPHPERQTRRRPATLDSRVYTRPFYGILNAEGDFWSPHVFASEQAARESIIVFWGDQTTARDQCLSSHKIVPIRVRLAEIKP